MKTTLQPLVQQLLELGYKPGNRVYGACLIAKNYPVEEARKKGLTYIDKKGQEQKSSFAWYLVFSKDDAVGLWEKRGEYKPKYFSDGLKRLQELNRLGYGVYLRVNPGGHEDADITEARSIFFECDAVSKSEQWEQIRALEADFGVKPLVIETRKSLHTYFLLNAPQTDLNEWKRYQQRLIQRVDSDKSIYNPSRLMRLAGFDHVLWNGSELGFTPVDLVQESSGKVSLELCDRILPEWDAEQWAPKNDENAAPCDPQENPWDIRNFAHYLEGFQEYGRDGWHTCKCPAHNGESSDSLHIKADNGAFKCQAGCSGQSVYTAALEYAISKGFEKPKGRGKGFKKEVLPHYNLSLTPDLVVQGKYLPDDLQDRIPDDVELVVIRTPKGSGKTEFLGRMVASNKAKSIVTDCFVHREQLGLQLATRINLPYKDQPDMGRLGKVRCIDSMRPESDPPYVVTPGNVLAIDEAESTLWQLLDGSTNIDRRISILKTLRDGAQVAKRIVLLDADLSDLTIGFIQTLVGRKLKTYVVESTYKPEKGWKVFSYNNAPSLYKKLMQTVEKGGKHMVLVCGQKVDSKWSTQTLETSIKVQYPALKVLRVDSETITNPNHPAYRLLENPDIDSFLAQFDIIIASPTIESGCSVNLRGHFDGVWCYATGVLPENSVRQFLARVRDESVPRHVFIAERGMNTSFVGSGDTEPAKLLQKQQKKANYALESWHDAWANSISKGILNTDFLNVGLKYWSHYGGRINQGLHNYRKSVLTGLEAEGHQIIDGDVSLDKEAAKAVSEQVGAIRDENTEMQNIKIAEADLITDDEFKAREQRKEKTVEERWEDQKYKIHRRYALQEGQEVTADLVSKDRDGLYSKWRLHYYLTIGAEFAQRRDGKVLEELTKTNNLAWVPDVNRRVIGAKLRIMEELGVSQVLADAIKGKEFTAADVLHIQEKALTEAEKLKNILGITVTEKTKPMAVVQEILDQAIGLRLASKQKRVEGKHVWHFSWKAPEDGRQTYLENWLARDQAIAAKEAEERESVTSNANIYIQQSDVTPDVTENRSCLDVQNALLAQLGYQPSVTVTSNANIYIQQSDVTRCDVTEMVLPDLSPLSLEEQADFLAMWADAGADLEMQNQVIEMVVELIAAVDKLTV